MIKSNNISRKITDIIGYAFLIMGFIILISTFRFVSSRDIWFDELFTVRLAQMPLKELLSQAGKDVHPPLYYLIVRLFFCLSKIVYKSTDIIIVSKITSIIPYVLMFIYALIYIRKHFGVLSAGLFVIFIQCMPQLTAYMVEARMYSWAMFVVLGMFVHSAECIALHLDKKAYFHLAIAGLYALAGMYLHYYSFFAVAIIGCILLCTFVRFRCRNMIIATASCMCICLVAYTPWIRTVISQVGEVKSSYWIPPVTIRTIAGCAKYIFKPEFESTLLNYFCVAFLIGAYVLTAIIYVIKKDVVANKENLWKKQFVVNTFIVTCGLVIVGIALSVIVRPIFVYRYMIPVLGAFWLGFAIASAWFIENLNIKYSVAFALPFVAIIACMSMRNFNMFKWEEQKKIQGMSDTETALQMIADEYQDAMLVCNFNQLQAEMWYYLNNASVLWGETDETLIADISGRSPMVMTDDTDYLMNVVTLQNSIVDDKEGFLFMGSGNAREEILSLWNNEGLNTEIIADSCLLERYYFNIYKVTK